MSYRLVFGCMTGTSIDALDVAAVEISGSGISMTAQFRCGESHDLGPLRDPLRRLANQAALTAGEIAATSAQFAQSHIAAFEQLRARVGRGPDLIAVHGQTVFHAPPISWQLLQPTPIAAALQAPVVCDLRQADLAAGGQGAPITPLADYILYCAPRETRTILNLGGFCNYTRLPAAGDDSQADLSQIAGGDVCACNHLLNQIARERLNCEFDRDGAAAGRGTSDARAQHELEQLLASQRSSGRSLGTGDEIAQWLGRHAPLRSEDVARTACEALGAVISSSVGDTQRIVLAGGGTMNQTLVAAIRRNSAVPAAQSDDIGIPSQYREAIAMAVLGALCQDGVPITLPRVTGAASAGRGGCWVFP